MSQKRAEQCLSPYSAPAKAANPLVRGLLRPLRHDGGTRRIEDGQSDGATSDLWEVKIEHYGLFEGRERVAEE